jgi:hypothetical protein
MIYENIFDSLETGLPLTRKAKKTEQINIRFTEKAVQDLDRIAAAESRDRSELARFFVEWASAQYDSVGSLRTLLRSPALPRTGRVSPETQEQLFTALRIILEHAPSAVIEDVTRKISRYAAEYGEK